MRTVKKTALAALLGTALVATPALAHAHGWGGWGPRPYHFGFYAPAPLIGLGIASAVIGTAAVVDSIVRPRVYVAAPPPPPYYPYYDDAYRRGYDEGRRDGYYDDGDRR